MVADKHTTLTINGGWTTVMVVVVLDIMAIQGTSKDQE
jgi:hypothetical protein